jgi:hypothetical protein
MPALPQTPLIPQDGTLLILDKTSPSPLEHEVKYEDGVYKIDNIKKGQGKLEIFRDRGKPYSAREGDWEEIEGTFECHAVGMTDATTATILDVIRRTGVWAAAVSQLDAEYGDAYLLKFKWTGERTNFGDAADDQVILKYCHPTAGFSEGTPGKFSIKFTAIKFAHDASASFEVL